LRLIRDRKTNAAIAEELGLTLNTVKFHVANMLAKLHLPDREALAAWKHESRNPAKWLLGWPALVGGSVAALTVAAVVAISIGHNGSPDPASERISSVPTAVSTLPPVPPGAPVGLLAFIATQPGGEGSKLVVVPAVGGTGTVLIAGAGALFSPTWSPDGGAVAYLQADGDRLPDSEEESTSVSLRLVELAIGETRILKSTDVSLRSSPAVLERPSWRPDGGRLVVSTRGFITSRINRDGTDEREEVLGCDTPSWAPDGMHGTCTVASTSQPEFNQVTLAAVSPEFRTSGYGGERVTSGWTQTYGNRGIPAHGLFNQDSTWFTWWTYDLGTAPSVWSVPIDTKGLPPAEPVRVATGLDSRWSPDGRLLVFSTTTDLSFPPRLAPADIVLYDTETGVLSTLVRGGSNRWPVWSPDGRHIAFVSDTDRPEGEVYVIRVDGTEVTRLTFNETAESGLDWGPTP
jgi:dipeptidyl aminopeptidase/acylaminoacyl peptidase